MRYSPWGAALAAAAIAQAAVVTTAAAQNEGALRAAFEGRSVTLRIDMPATSQGVDVYPQDGMPVNFREVAQRLKDNGTGVKTGQSVMVTKVAVKKQHIEFQLGGGGYGTFMDWATNGNDVTAVGANETAQERSLRESLKGASGDDKKRLQRELDGLRSARQRENTRAQAEAQQANLAREASIRAKRLDAGSRFNIRFRNGLPPEALTPEGVARALAQYADFANVPAVASAVAPAATPNGMPGAAPAAAPPAGVRAFASHVANAAPGGAAAQPAAAVSAPAAAQGGVGALRKGMALADVEALLGPAATASETRDGSMTVTRRTYRPEGAQVQARFVAGVLVDYAITPR
jgi:hypothetical protein